MRYYLHLYHVACVTSAITLFNAAQQANACTVFTITDGQRSDNEDFSNPRTRIWFVPGSDDRHGCVFLGFDDGWGQNGLNDKGLAYGWVAGFKEKWQRKPEMNTFDGKPCHRMLESCATVEEAIAFFKNNWEESFSYGRLLVADRSGKSAIIRAKDGQLHAPIVARSQGMGHRFGLRGNEATPLLAKVSTPTLIDAARLLEFTRQEGIHATKYSVVFDLQSRDIWLYHFLEQRDAVQFNLPQQLKMDPHYYDIPALPNQLTDELRPLTENMTKY
jgi:hypothetical protein